MLQAKFQVELSNKITVPADHTKKGLKSSYFFLTPDDVDILISSRSPEKALKRALKQHGAKLAAPGRERA
ncbi:MAG: hypothetical protein ACLQSR_17775 [Limisphaerales bacterium]